MARNDNMRRGAPTPRPPRRERSRFGRFLRRTLIWSISLALLAALALAVAVGLTAQSLPSYDELKDKQLGEQMIVVRARDGSELVSLGPSYGKWLNYSEIPKVMRDAMVSVEDRRFRSHIGVDPIGIARAVSVRISGGRWRQGASTISQQLARNIFLNNSRTVTRKLREAILALALEW